MSWTQQEAPTTAARTFPSKYDGYCPSCKVPIRVGDMVVFNEPAWTGPRGGTYKCRHADCPDPHVSKPVTSTPQTGELAPALSAFLGELKAIRALQEALVARRGDNVNVLGTRSEEAP